MEIFVKIFNGKLVRIFDTKKDKKKEIILTTVNDYQREAEANFYVSGRKVETLTFKNLPPAKARILDLPVIVELIDNKDFTIRYKGRNDIEEKHKIDIRKFKIADLQKYIMPSVIILIILLIPLLIFTWIKLDLNRFFKINKISNNSTYVKNKDENIENKKDVDKNNNDNKDQKKEENLYTITTLKDVINKNTPIYFIKDKAVLLDNEIDKINNITDYLKNYEKIEIIIHGHTADIGLPQNELALSKQRANYIKNIFNKNLNEKKFVYKTIGHGANNLANKSLDKQYLNRRVELELVKTE